MSPLPGESPVRILYVDDEEANRKVFRLNFEDQFPLRYASSAERALEILEEEEIAVLLVDERMPGMHGSELLALVKQSHPDIVRMVVTAYSDVNAVLAAVNSGEVWRYILKPWEAGAVATLLGAGLDIYQLTRDRRALNVQLVLAERRATLGLLAGSVGHELRNALSAPLNATHVLAEMVPTFRKAFALCVAPHASAELRAELEELQVGPELKELEFWVAAMKESLEHARDISVQLVDSMKPQALLVTPLDLSALVKSVGRLTRDAVFRAGARLSVEVEEGVTAQGDAVAVRQVLINLLLNGAQAIPEVRQPGTVTLKCSRQDGGAVVEVGDDGTGISPEHLARMFERLFTTKGNSGTGMGLAISRSLAQQMGGDLTLCTVLGEGTTFSLTLKG